MEENRVSAIGQKCPRCGAEAVFDPATGKLKCPHCGEEQEIEGQAVYAEQDFVLSAISYEEWEDGRSYRCDNCGAVTVLDRNELAGACPFCNSPKVVDAGDQPGVKPMGIIPFSIDKEKAKLGLATFIKKRIFAPRKFKKNFVPDNMKGVYVPCWLFDTKSVATYTGRFGKYYTVVVGSGKNRKTVRKIRWYNSSGRVERTFDDFPVEASARIDQRTFDKISPYSTEAPLRYDGKYMLGFSAERYQENPEECFKRACDGMKEILKGDCVRCEGADVVGEINVHVVHNDVKYKYLLLPVYMCTEEYKNKRYGYYINGESGKATGRTPKSPIRVGIAVLLGLVLLGVIGYFAYQYALIS